jgi:hypothetical protein
MLLAACNQGEVATSAPAPARAAVTWVAGTRPPNTVATAAAMATAAAGPTSPATSTASPPATITGEVTQADPVTRTFTVRGADGKVLALNASANSQIDLAALAATLAAGQRVTVTYRGTAPPYEAISVR